MNNLVYTENYKGSRIEIFVDEDSPNPRTDFDQFGRMICWHRRYDLGDKHNYSDPQEFIDALASEISSEEISKLEYQRDNEVARNRAIDENTIIIPLHLYDHSGISISASHTYPYNDMWDSMQVGYCYATRAMIENEYGKFDNTTKEKARSLMLAEIETYNDYLTGNVYGYVVTDNITSETDSCWGYFGDYEAKGSALDEARAVAAHNAKSHKESLKRKDAETARVKGMWNRAAGK